MIGSVDFWTVSDLDLLHHTKRIESEDDALFQEAVIFAQTYWKLCVTQILENTDNSVLNI